MLKKFVTLSNFTLITALTLSTVAAYYSIYGLTAIFAGAVIPIIIMGGILELGKIVTTVWLRKYWHRCSWVLKAYLVPAVVLLALLTSMGIFGFLSKAHTDSGLVSGDVQAKLSLIDEKIKTQRDNIEIARKALQQMDAQVDARLARGDSESGAERAVQIRRQQAGERAKLQKEIGEAQKVIATLNEERAPIAAENRKVEAEVGPIKYVAALIYGDDPDTNLLERAVRWVIILLVVVFDPLAIALVLAANASKDWDNEEESNKPDAWVADVGEKPTLEEIEPAYEPDDGPLTENQIEQIKEASDESLGNCYKCDTPIIKVPGIGPFCPNKECGVSDNTTGAEVEFVEEKVHKPDTHPYLNEGFKYPAGWEHQAPLVAKPDEPPIPEPAPEPEKKTGEDLSVNTNNSMQVKQDLPFEELPGGYVAYEGKQMSKDALFSMRPEFLRLTADLSKPVNSSFGTKFPDEATKGDVFTRVDALPNKVFKFDGVRWIEINKNSSNTYLYNTKYLEYLISMIDNGQYDPELLSENEKAQIEDYLKIQKISKRVD